MLKTEITHVRQYRTDRNDRICREFKEAEGQIMAICDRIARKEHMSVDSIRRILRNAGLVGKNQKPCGT